MLSHWLCVPCYSHHVFYVLGLLKGFWPYIWPQTPLAGQNHTNNNLPSILAYIVPSRYWVFDLQAMTISTPQSMACSRGFSRQVCDLGDVRGICEQAGHSGSWVGSKTLWLVGAKLGSQILAVVGGRMGFQVFSNWVTVIGGTESCRSCRS